MDSDSGLEQKKPVDALLTSWTPEALTIAEVSFFPSSNPEEKYITLIAKLAVTPNLLDANNRLRKLPHIDLHPDYVPHITLAYLNDTSDYQGYVQKLNGVLQGKTVKALGLNYGD